MTPQDLYVTVSTIEEIPACGVCGKPSLYGACDIKEIPTNDGYRHFEIFGNPKYGCEDHKVVSHTYDIEGNLIR
jgi:hypothetical protein